MSAPMEGGHDSDYWLFDSLKKYRNLHMFELSHPTKSLSWIGTGSVCVASADGNGRSEILQLGLPDKLLAEDDEGTCRDRDFTVLSGGFHAGVIEQIKHIKDLSLIVTSESGGENAIRVWQLGDTDSDVISCVSTVSHVSADLSPARLGVHGRLIAHGSKMDDICVYDVDSEKTTYSSTACPDSERLSGLELLSPHTLLACSESSGDIVTIDTRAGKQPTQCSKIITPTATSRWSFCSTQKTLCAGAINSFNSRSFPKIGQHSPQQDQVISVSGLDGHIYIFNYSHWAPDGSTSSSAAPDFIHEGHVTCSDQSEPVLGLHHLWHPVQPRLLLSAGSDASLHAWDYNA